MSRVALIDVRLSSSPGSEFYSRLFNSASAQTFIASAILLSSALVEPPQSHNPTHHGPDDHAHQRNSKRSETIILQVTGGDMWVQPIKVRGQHDYYAESDRPTDCRSHPEPDAATPVCGKGPQSPKEGTNNSAGTDKYHYKEDPDQAFATLDTGMQSRGYTMTAKRKPAGPPNRLPKMAPTKSLASISRTSDTREVIRDNPYTRRNDQAQPTCIGRARKSCPILPRCFPFPRQAALKAKNQVPM